MGHPQPYGREPSRHAGARHAHDTDLILHGPPGTGRTYRSAFEAERLCRGEEAAGQLACNGQRGALMTEYRRLVAEGRIEFVTLHHPTSHEGFVAGLRPGTGGNSGFRLLPVSGVFRTICARAQADTGAATMTLQGRARMS